MELFKDPDSRKPRADSILQQFPKRMNLELDLDEAEMNEAWGIYYRETGTGHGFGQCWALHFSRRVCYLAFYGVFLSVIFREHLG